MKLLQLNTWGSRLGKQIEDLFDKEKPDIVCLQEAIDIPGDGAVCTPNHELQEHGNLEFSFHSPVFSFNLMNKSAQFGNTIMSKKPFVTTETIFTNLDYKPDFSFDSDDYNIRNLQHAVVEHEGKLINILNHHGHHVREHKKGNDDTLRQMKQISQYIKTLNGPVILTGDFNLAPDSESLNILNNQLENLCITHRVKTTRSFLTHKTEVCDFIFVSKDIPVKSFRVSEELVSDHLAVILEF